MAKRCRLTLRVADVIPTFVGEFFAKRAGNYDTFHENLCKLTHHYLEMLFFRFVGSWLVS